MRATFSFCFFFLCITIGFTQLKDTVIYHPTGEKLAQGKIRNGIKEGVWTSYYKSGARRTITFFQNGKAEGPDYSYSGKEYVYFPNGNLKEEYNWSKGKIDGIQKQYYANGLLRKKYRAVNGLYYTEMKEYYPDSNHTLKSVIRYDWDKTASVENMIIKDTALVAASQGKELSYLRFPTLRSSSWTYYYSSGILKTEGGYEKGDYKKGQKERCWEYIYLESKERHVMIYQYKKENDSKFNFSGKEFLYFPDSTVREERNWQQGKLEGIQKQYYHSGALKKESPCLNGLFHGTVKEYYESGQLYSEVACVYGRDTSAKKIYYANGRLKQEGPLKDGCYKRYDTLGNRIRYPNYRIYGMDDKPVIYLYPEKETKVEVTLQYKGAFSYTYPEYKNGWKVTAFPDGKIFNEEDGQEYSYLFWEGENQQDYLSSIDLSNGAVVKGEHTQAFLRKSLAEMGLLPKEYNEFIVYWMPKMLHNNYNYIHFLTRKEYDQVAGIKVAPVPDAMLRIFMVFIPLENPIEVRPQTIHPFERKGFTLIEWGGTQAQEPIKEF